MHFDAGKVHCSDDLELIHRSKLAFKNLVQEVRKSTFISQTHQLLHCRMDIYTLDLERGYSKFYTVRI